jgi:hypothetical protein
VNGEDCITKSFNFGNTKRDEKGIAWSACLGGGGEEIFYSDLMEKPERQREHERSSLDVKRIGWEEVNWIDLVQERGN